MDAWPHVLDFLRWLEATPPALFIRVSDRLYPVLMSIHVVGIALLLGPALAVDLRLLGFGRKAVAVTTATRHLLPISHAGFAIVLITGVAMFVAIAYTVGNSWAAPWKFGLIAVAGLNILIFHKGVYRTVERWDVDSPTPIAAKIAALVSATSWIGVIFGGRFLAY